MAFETYRVFIVRGDDWQGLYINGKLYTEDHSIDADDLIKVIREYSVFEDAVINDLNDEGMVWLENQGGFPDKLNEIKLEYFHRHK